ncbi:MAG TPA: hypothetical protein VFC63_10400, partial [Blastocatellia bacterium]|nr:hypothetical protein [Blastocatellia bacterium]
ANENLTRLVGKDKTDGLIAKAKTELVEQRTIKLQSLLKNEKEKLEGDFFIMLIPTATFGVRVADVKFINGSEKLGKLADSLKSMKFDLTFPDDIGTKIFRRGKLVYEPKDGSWSFVLYLQDDADTNDQASADSKKKP